MYAVWKVLLRTSISSGRAAFNEHFPSQILNCLSRRYKVDLVDFLSEQHKFCLRAFLGSHLLRECPGEVLLMRIIWTGLAVTFQKYRLQKLRRVFSVGDLYVSGPDGNWAIVGTKSWMGWVVNCDKYLSYSEYTECILEVGTTEKGFRKSISVIPVSLKWPWNQS